MNLWKSRGERAKITVGLLVLAFVLDAMVLKEYIELSELERSAQHINGSVIEKNCMTHGRISYTYTVSGQPYYGSAIATDCGFASCIQTDVGKAVDIISSKEKPSLAICRPIQAERNSLTWSAWVLSIFTIAGLFEFYKMRFR